MYCIQTEIPQEICDIDDELKAIYHSKIRFAYGFLRREKIEIDLWTKLLECSRMRESSTLNLFINNLKRNLL